MSVRCAAETGECTAKQTPLPAGQLREHKVGGGVRVFTAPTQKAAASDFGDGTCQRLWHAAPIFIEYLLSAGLSPGLRVVELGSGCGAVGLALHAHLGCHVTLTDVQLAMPLLQLNSERNPQQPSVEPSRRRICPLHWGDAAAAAALLESTPGHSFDVRCLLHALTPATAHGPAARGRWW